MKRLLVIIIQQHGDDGRFVLVFSEAAGKRFEALAALRLQFVPGTQSRFEQGRHTFRDNRCHVRICRNGQFRH